MIDQRYYFQFIDLIANHFNNQIKSNFNLNHSYITLKLNELRIKTYNNEFDILIEFNESIDTLKFKINHEITYFSDYDFNSLRYDYTTKSDLLEFIINIQEYLYKAIYKKNNFISWFRNAYINFSNEYKNDFVREMHAYYRLNNILTPKTYIYANLICKYQHEEFSRIGKDSKLKSSYLYMLKLEYNNIKNVSNIQIDLLTKINFLLEKEEIYHCQDVDYSGGSASSEVINKTTEQYNFLVSRIINQNFHLINSEEKLTNNFSEFINLIKKEFPKILSPHEYLNIHVKDSYVKKYNKAILYSLPITNGKFYQFAIYCFIVLFYGTNSRRDDINQSAIIKNLFFWDFFHLIKYRKTFSFEKIEILREKMDIDTMIIHQFYNIYIDSEYMIYINNLFFEINNYPIINNLIEWYILNSSKLDITLLNSDKDFYKTFFK